MMKPTKNAPMTVLRVKPSSKRTTFPSGPSSSETVSTCARSAAISSMATRSLSNDLQLPEYVHHLWHWFLPNPVHVEPETRENFAVKHTVRIDGHVFEIGR